MKRIPLTVAWVITLCWVIIWASYVYVIGPTYTPGLIVWSLFVGIAGALLPWGFTDYSSL